MIGNPILTETNGDKGLCRSAVVAQAHPAAVRLSATSKRGNESDNRANGKEKDCSATRADLDAARNGKRKRSAVDIDVRTASTASGDDSDSDSDNKLHKSQRAIDQRNAMKKR